MPLLVFKCVCGNMPERLYSPTKAAKMQTVICEHCGQIAKRVLAPPAPPQFTGTGFYATDYKGKP